MKKSPGNNTISSSTIVSCSRTCVRNAPLEHNAARCAYAIEAIEAIEVKGRINL
jgi:hypothetical protein